MMDPLDILFFFCIGNDWSGGGGEMRVNILMAEEDGNLNIFVTGAPRRA